MRTTMSSTSSSATPGIVRCSSSSVYSVAASARPFRVTDSSVSSWPCLVAHPEASVFTLIDHVMICVPDLERGIEQYTNLGFNIYAGGVHPGQGTHNAIAFNGADYLELLAIRDPVEAAGRWGTAG